MKGHIPHYEGDFKNNLKEGLGIQELSNGQKYIGEFEKNKRNGEGQIVDAEGRTVKKGRWKSNKLISQ